MKNRSVMVRVPNGIYERIAKLVKQGKFRSVADFFYVAGQKELEKHILECREEEDP